MSEEMTYPQVLLHLEDEVGALVEDLHEINHMLDEARSRAKRVDYPLAVLLGRMQSRVRNALDVYSIT